MLRSFSLRRRCWLNSIDGRLLSEGEGRASRDGHRKFVVEGRGRNHHRRQAGGGQGTRRWVLNVGLDGWLVGWLAGA